MSSPAKRGQNGGRPSNYDHLVKLLVIGDSGIDYKIRSVELDGKRIKMQIWDTAGQERFRTITSAYYRGAMGIMLVYDVTDERSFNNIRNWIKNVEQNASEGVNMIIVGNKTDVADKRVVAKEKGQALANEYGFPFIETSAMNNINVDEAFLSLTRAVKSRLIDTQEAEQDKARPVHLAAGPYERIRSSCCFGGGGQATAKGPAKTSTAAKSPARSVKGSKPTQ